VAKWWELLVPATAGVAGGWGASWLQARTSIAALKLQANQARTSKFEEARQIAYAQFISAASGFLFSGETPALAPGADTQLRDAYGATVLLGSPPVRDAARAVIDASFAPSGHALTKSLQDAFLEAVRQEQLDERGMRRPA
jgi:hypothetical protein